jgi:hypothetical protein
MRVVNKHLPVRRDAFILRVTARYITANISGVELQETQRMSAVLGLNCR